MLKFFSEESMKNQKGWIRNAWFFTKHFVLPGLLYSLIAFVVLVLLVNGEAVTSWLSNWFGQFTLPQHFV